MITSCLEIQVLEIKKNLFLSIFFLPFLHFFIFSLHYLFLQIYKKMSFDTLAVGEKVLFVAPATVDQPTFLHVKNSAQDQVGPTGQTSFEVLERVADGKFWDIILI